MNPSADPALPRNEALLAEEARTRRALLHMLEDLQREHGVVLQAKQHWLDTVDAIDAPLLVHDEEFRVVRANRAYATQAGMGFEEIIGRPYWECFPRIAQARQGMPAQFALPGGETFAVRSFPVKEGDEKGAAWLHLFEDVTQRCRVENQVRALQDVSASEFILKGEVEAVAGQITEAAARVTGVARANVWLFNEAEDELRCIDLYESMSGGHSSGMVLRESEFANEFAALKSAPYVDANEPLTDPRTRGYVESYVKPLGITSMLDTVVEVSGKLIGLLCLEHVGRAHHWQPDEISFANRLADKIAVAVTNRQTREVQEALREREEERRMLFESSKDAFMTLASPDWRFTSCNPSALAMFGAKDEADFVSRKPWDFSPERQPDGRLSAEKAREMIEIAMRDGSHFFDWTHLRPGGEEFAATVLLTRLTLKGSTLLNACVRDVTELRKARELVERRERYFRKLIEGSADAFFVIDRAGKLVYRSESGTRLTGHQTADVMGKDLTTFVTPESLADARRAIGEAIAHPERLSQAELRIVRADGKFLDVEATGRNQLADPDVNGIVVTARDISARKKAERKLRRVNRALKTLSAGNEALVRATDEAGLLNEMARILSEVGGYAVAWVGYARDDAGRSVEPMACVGVEPGALLRPQVTWADNERGQSVMGRAIRLGSTQVARNVKSDPCFLPWREMLSACSVGSCLGLPIRVAAGERPFGAIAIGAAEVDSFDEDELKLLEELAGDLAYGIANLRAGVEQRAAGEKLRRSLEGTIGAVAATMESRDPYTAGHQRRVAVLASAIATEMGLAASAVEGIHFGALIHDLGKIQVPAEILSKPTRLSKLEFDLIKEHARAGYEIIKGIDFPWPIALMVWQHHERLDGSGYPQGLKGEAISPEARILAVADVVEAMSSHRPYRPGLGVDAALREIEDKRGKWFEPAAVDACLRLFREKQFSLEAT